MGGWRIERARSSKSKCRVCARAIAEGEQRFGQDEKNATWFHLGCAAEGAPRAAKPFAAQIARALNRPKAASKTAAPSKPPPNIVAALAANLDDRDALTVLADWLQSNADPWGELIALELAGRPVEAQAHFKQHAADLTGGFAASSIEWKHGCIWSADAGSKSAAKAASLVSDLFAVRTTALLQRLLVTRSTPQLFEMISRRAPPSLRQLAIELPADGLDALALPQVDRLDVRLRGPLAGSDHDLLKAKLPGLRHLRIEGKGGDAGMLGTGPAVLSVAFLEALFASPLLRQLELLALNFGALDAAGHAFVVSRAASLAHLEGIDLTQPRRITHKVLAPRIAAYRVAWDALHIEDEDGFQLVPDVRTYRV
jgi:hypothetical protein